MSKYKQAIGVWRHQIGEIVHELVPEEDDNYRFLRAKDEAQKKNDGAIIHKRVGELYFDMVIRAYPSLSEEDIKELRTWIAVNINKIVEDFLVAFRWTTDEDLKSIKKNFEPKKEKSQ